MSQIDEILKQIQALEEQRKEYVSDEPVVPTADPLAGVVGDVDMNTSLVETLEQRETERIVMGESPQEEEAPPVDDGMEFTFVGGLDTGGDQATFGNVMKETGKGTLRNILQTIKGTVGEYLLPEDATIRLQQPGQEEQTVDMYEKLPDNPAKKIVTDLDKAMAHKFLKQNKEVMKDMGFIDQLMYAAPNVGISMGLTYLTKRPNVGTAFMGTQIMGNQIEELTGQGVDLRTATHHAAINAITQMPMERLGIDNMSKLWKFKTAIANRVKHIMVATASEGVTEGLQVLPERITNILAKDVSKKELEAIWEVLSDPETYKQMGIEGAMGAIFGFTIGAGGALKNMTLDEAAKIVKQADLKKDYNRANEEFNNLRKPDRESAVLDDPTVDELTEALLRKDADDTVKREARAARKLAQKKAREAKKAEKEKASEPTTSPKDESKKSTEGTEGTSGKAGSRFSPQQPTGKTETTPETETKTEKPEKDVPTEDTKKAGGRFAPTPPAKTQTTEETKATDKEVTSNVPDFKNQVDAVAWAKENQGSLPDIQKKLQDVSQKWEQETDLEKKMELANQQDALRHAEAIAQGKGTLYEQIKKRDAEMAAEKQRQEKAKADEAEKQRQQALHNKKEQTAATLAKKKAEAEAAYKAKLKAGENVEADKKPAAKDMATTGLLTEGGELITGDLDIEGLSPSQFSQQQAEDLVDSFNEIKKKWPNHWRKAKKVLVTKDGRYFPLGKYIEKAKLIEKVQNKKKGPDTTNRTKDAAVANQKRINEMYRKEEALPLTDDERKQLDDMLKTDSEWDKKLDAVSKILGDDTDQIRDYKAAAQLALTEHFAKGKDMDKFDPMLAAKTYYNRQYRGEGMGAAASGVRLGAYKGRSDEDAADVEAASPMAEGTKHKKGKVKAEKVDEGDLNIQEKVESDAEYDRQQEVLDIVQAMNRKIARNKNYKPTKREVLAKKELDAYVKTKKASKKTLEQKREMDMIRDERAKVKQEEKVNKDWAKKLKDGGWEEMLGKEIEIEQIGEYTPGDPTTLKLIYRVVPKTDPSYLKKKQREQKLIEMKKALRESVGGMTQGATEVMVMEQLDDGTTQVQVRLDTRSSMLRDLNVEGRKGRAKTNRRDAFEAMHDSNFFMYVPVGKDGDTVVWGYVPKPKIKHEQADIKKMSRKERMHYEAMRARFQDAMAYANRIKNFYVGKSDAEVEALKKAVEGEGPVAKRQFAKRIYALQQKALQAREKALENQKKYDLERKRRIVAEFVEQTKAAESKKEAQQKKVDEDLELQQLLDLDITQLRDMLRISRDKKILSKVAKAIRIKRKDIPKKQTVINRTKGTRKEVGQVAAQQKPEQTTAAKKLKESKKTKATPTPKAGNRFAPEVKTVELTENIAESETIVPKEKKPKAGSRFGAVVRNEKGGMEIRIPGRDKVLSMPKKLGELWTRGIDRVYDKASDGLVWLSQHNAKTDLVLSAFVEKFGQDQNFKDMGRDYDVAIHSAQLLGDRLDVAISNIDSQFGDIDVMETTKAKDKYGRVLNPNIKRSEKSKARMKNALEKRKKQIAEGGITMYDEKYGALRRAATEFQKLEKELRARGILNDHQFRELNKRERAKALTEVQQIDDDIVAIENSEISEREKGTAIDKKMKEKRDILTRLQVHYKNSGKNYLSQIQETIDYGDKIKRQVALDAMNKKYAKRRKNWKVWVEDGVTHVRRLSSKELKKDATLADAGTTVRKGLVQEIHDMHLHDLFTNIAKHSEEYKLLGDRTPWSAPAKDLKLNGKGTKGVHSETGARYKKIPDKSENFGDLAGTYVEEHVYRELQNSFKDYAKWQQVANKMYSSWKAGKTVYNPATSARNFVSNIGLAYALGDTSFFRPRNFGYWTEALKEYWTVTGGFDKRKMGIPDTKYGEEIASKTKIYSSSFTQAEIGKDGKDLIAASIQKLGKLSPHEGLAHMVDMASKLGPVAYDMMEVSMKSMIYKNARENMGLSIEKAEALANKALFDYGSVPPAIQFARNFYSPFITYSYKALPALAKQATRKPWKLVPFYLMLQSVQMLSQAMFGEDDEDREWNERSLPDYVRRDTMPIGNAFPSHIRMPFQTKDGLYKYLDMSFYLPWGGATDMAEGALAWMPSSVAPNHPVLNTIGSWKANADLFTGQPIYLDTDLDGQKVFKFLEKTYNELAPAALDTNKWKKIWGAVHGKTDIQGRQDYSVADALLDWTFGIKFRNFDYIEERSYRARDLQAQAKEIREVYKKKVNNHLIKNANDPLTPDMEDIMAEYEKKLDILQDKWFHLYMVENE